MQQEKIWEYFQNQGVAVFAGNVSRLRFLFRRARKLAKKKHTRALNIGIGNGWLERRCAEEGWEIYALDPSKSAVEGLRRVGVRAKEGSIERMPFQDGLFDIVFCSEILEHLSDEQLCQGLKEIKRVQKDDARLIGTVPFNEDLRESDVVCPNCGERFHRWGHTQSFGKAGIAARLEQSGFTVVSLKTYAFPDFSKPSLSAFVRDLIRWPLGRIGSPLVYSNLLFVAKKAKARVESSA